MQRYVDRFDFPMACSERTCVGISTRNVEGELCVCIVVYMCVCVSACVSTCTRHSDCHAIGKEHFSFKHAAELFVLVVYTNIHTQAHSEKRMCIRPNINYRPYFRPFSDFFLCSKDDNATHNDPITLLQQPMAGFLVQY